MMGVILLLILYMKKNAYFDS